LTFLDAESSFQMRPSFHALATLQEQLAGATFFGPLEIESPAWLYHFQRELGDEVIVGWSTSGSVKVTLPRPASRVIGRDGEQLEAPAGEKVELGPTPRYFFLED